MRQLVQGCCSVAMRFDKCRRYAASHAAHVCPKTASCSMHTNLRMMPLMTACMLLPACTGTAYDPSQTHCPLCTAADSSVSLSNVDLLLLAPPCTSCSTIGTALDVPSPHAFPSVQSPASVVPDLYTILTKPSTPATLWSLPPQLLECLDPLMQLLHSKLLCPHAMHAVCMLCLCQLLSPSRVPQSTFVGQPQ